MCRSATWLTRRSRNRQTRSSGSPRPLSAARTCTCTSVLGPYLKPGRRARARGHGHRRGNRSRGRDLRSATGWSSPSTFPAGTCWMCERGLYAQCETTQVREIRARARRCSATRPCTARCPAARPSTCGFRRPSSGRSRSRKGRRRAFLYLSDVLPTAYQAVVYADVPDGGTLAVLGPGPGGPAGGPDRPAPRGRASHRRRRVPERLAASGAVRGAETVDPRTGQATWPTTLIGLTDGRGRTRSSTPWGWRPTATAHRRPRRRNRRRRRRPA